MKRINTLAFTSADASIAQSQKAVAQDRLEDTVIVPLGTILRDSKTGVDYVYIGRSKNTVGYNYHFAPDAGAYNGHGMTANYAKLETSIKRFPELKNYIAVKTTEEASAQTEQLESLSTTIHTEAEKREVSRPKGMKMVNNDNEGLRLIIAHLRTEMQEVVTLAQNSIRTNSLDPEDWRADMHVIVSKINSRLEC